MIIKRKLKTRLHSSLKRSSKSTNEEDEGRVARKKRKVSCNGGVYYYPLNILGEIAAGIVPGKLNGKNGLSALWCKEVSSSPVEAESESKSKRIVSDHGRGRDRTADVSRPPLVRTSRGRVQVLPSRFNDSVIENWREDSKSGGDEREEEIEECRKEKVKASSNNHSLKTRQREAKFTPRNHKYSNNSFDMRKQMSCSRTSTFASLHEQRFYARRMRVFLGQRIFILGNWFGVNLEGMSRFGQLLLSIQ